MATKLPNEYSEGSIRVLKGLEPVKQRPGMYTRTDSPLHIIQEAIDNAADMSLAQLVLDEARDVLTPTEFDQLGKAFDGAWKA